MGRAKKPKGRKPNRTNWLKKVKLIHENQVIINRLTNEKP